MDTFRLYNGMEVPCIANGPMALGYGKKKLYPHSFTGRLLRKTIYAPLEAYKYIHVVAESIRMGYTFIDYSTSYGDGSLIRRAIKLSGIGRDNLLLTTRVSNQDQRTGKIRKSVEAQMKSFGTDYIDLLMFHWPVPDCFVKSWKEMEKMYEEGICRAIGVANCHRHHLERIMSECNIVPMINQIEIHPLFSQKPLISYCQKMNIQVQAYTPIARYDDRLMRLPKLRTIGNKYGKSVTQVILKWHIGGGNSCYS